MVCLSVLSQAGLVGCTNSASLPASPTTRTSRSQRAVQQASHEMVRSDSLRVQPATLSNPWKPKVKERAWKYMVLHHTASEAGSIQSIDKAHRQRKDSAGRPWLGIGYHFVIGNGNGMADGETQPTFRWTRQLHGAHAGVADYNQLGIGIVLVGNFEKSRPTPAQLQSARRLVRTLRTAYGIDNENIVTHGDVNRTACPGRYFSLARITGVDHDVSLRATSGPNNLPLTFAASRDVP